MKLKREKVMILRRESSDFSVKENSQETLPKDSTNTRKLYDKVSPAYSFPLADTREPLGLAIFQGATLQLSH
jgi:hypothetical protein